MQSARTTVLWSEALKRKKRDWRISQKYQMESLALKPDFSAMESGSGQRAYI